VVRWIDSRNDGDNKYKSGSKEGDCRVWKVGEQLLSGEIHRHGIETQVWRKLYLCLPRSRRHRGDIALRGVKSLLEESCLW
jgi:hypothetical protein